MAPCCERLWSSRNPYQVLMRRIRRFDWTCGSRPPTLILHREATTLTKTEVWDRILIVFKEKFRPISWTRLIETDTGCGCPGKEGSQVAWRRRRSLQ